ncbi:MAG: SIS domain-containing protein [Anaerolineae bacterium]|nr:SIS domain-containing protein [Anaerolineae bacterium]
MEHYHMLDYIHESPIALEKTLKENEAAIRAIAQKAKEMNVDKVVLSGVGSSYTSCLMALPLFQVHCPFPTIVINSEETGYYAQRWVDAHSLVVVVSRSGERGAVIDTLQAANDAGALGVAVTGVADSLLAQTSKLSLITQEGPEITFPKTKSVSACVATLMRLGLALACPEDKAAQQRLEKLSLLSAEMKGFIESIEPQLLALLPKIAEHKLIDVVGTCSNHGTALEAAIKVQEATYIPTRGDSTAGLLQGPVGALNKDWLVYALVMPQDVELSKQLLKLTRGFHAYILAVHPQGLDLGGLADDEIVTPAFDDPYLAALVYLPAVQLLAYYWTVRRGMNPDAPASMESILQTILPPGRQEPEMRK